ncbi:hypothetical protein [Paraburkholderia sp. GAS334]|uniref:hypothetical protein n=1 Tax=Paraburkholderia sp. GAS334 TaxID=3035131 RepID=UPI003D1ACCBA
MNTRKGQQKAQDAQEEAPVGKDAPKKIRLGNKEKQVQPSTGATPIDRYGYKESPTKVRTRKKTKPRRKKQNPII